MTDKAKAREGSKPRCPNCNAGALRKVLPTVVLCDGCEHRFGDLYELEDFAQFFPIAAILEENQRLAKELEEWKEAAETKLRRMREALETIAAWPFDIRGDCVKDAKNLAEAALAK